MYFFFYYRNAFGIEDVGRFNRPRQTIFSLDPNVADFGTCQECGLTEIDALQVNFRYCNEPKDQMSERNLLEVMRRWMVIYRLRTSIFMARKLVNHLQLIFPRYHFIVIASAELNGGKDSHSSLQCVTVRDFGLDVTVCYNRPTRLNVGFNRNQVQARVQNKLNGKVITFFIQILLIQ